MAQWMGQFSGHTHATRVEDTEAALRQAVGSFRSEGSSEVREKKAQTIRRLAKRLRTTRLRILRARIAEAEVDLQTGRAPVKRAKEIALLRQNEATICEGGLDAILKEFGAEEATVA